MPKKTYTIEIMPGTKVLGKNGMIELLGSVRIPDAKREDGGEFSYMIGRNQYYCAAGCCTYRENL